MKNMKNNKKGFTLVELLAVIVILGILLLVAVPGIQTVLRNSRKKTFTSNLALAGNSIKTNISVTEEANCYVYINGGDEATGVASNIELERGSLDGITAIFYVNSDKEVHLLHAVDKTNKMVLGVAGNVKIEDIPGSTDKALSIGTDSFELKKLPNHSNDVVISNSVTAITEPAANVKTKCSM